MSPRKYTGNFNYEDRRLQDGLLEKLPNSKECKEETKFF